MKKNKKKPGPQSISFEFQHKIEHFSCPKCDGVVTQLIKRIKNKCGGWQDKTDKLVCKKCPNLAISLIPNTTQSVVFDKQTGILMLKLYTLSYGRPKNHHTKELVPGWVVDYDEYGNVIEIEVLDTKWIPEEVKKILPPEFIVTGYEETPATTILPKTKT